MAMKAALHVEVALREGITYLKKSFFTTPLKVANITEDKKAKTLYLMLMSSSPGILDGDEYDIKIALAAGSSLRLETQAYQRLYTMKAGATQHLQVHVSAGASFCFLPHPSVPHQASSFLTKNRFYLSANSTLIFGEVLTCGRKLNGEIFLFSKYHSITEVFLHNKLVVKENLLMEPANINVHAIGQLEGFTHQASLLYLNEQANAKSIIVKISFFLQAQPAIEFGISAAPQAGIIVRILGQKAGQLYDCLTDIARLLQQSGATI